MVNRCVGLMADGDRLSIVLTVIRLFHVTMSLIAELLAAAVGSLVSLPKKRKR